MTTLLRPAVLSVNISRAEARQIDGRAVLTAIGKRSVAGPVGVRPLGLAGDEQADLTVHGGLSKAVYAYPSEHLAFWQTVRAQAGVAGWNDAVPPGLMGENLTIAGLLEDDAFIGDVWRFPHCELAVSEPRFPCFKFTAAMGFKHATKLMSANGWCGFYLAVRTRGLISAGDAFEIVPGQREVGITELFRARVAGPRR